MSYRSLIFNGTSKNEMIRKKKHIRSCETLKKKSFVLQMNKQLRTRVCVCACVCASIFTSQGRGSHVTVM